jgi:cold-inducible RNA-binding protein
MNTTKLFVGSLPWSVTSDQLGQLFAQKGNVVSAQVISDKFSGRSKGFGFVEMATLEEAEAALELDGYSIDGRTINVNEARPQTERPPRDNNRSGGYNRNNSRGGYNSY